LIPANMANLCFSHSIFCIDLVFIIISFEKGTCHHILMRHEFKTWYVMCHFIDVTCQISVSDNYNHFKK